jgi:tetratricopeptide (TPR) repeat protein
MYALQRRFAEAEPLHLRALAIRETALGPDHPEVADNLFNLAVMYQSQGRLQEAEPLLTRAMAIEEKILGPDHSWTKATRDALDAIRSEKTGDLEGSPR